ncbi:MAG: serine protease [Lachnospiraceae bacterium]|nr:serine protease [Lachnospiraceae bacterium]
MKQQEKKGQEFDFIKEKIKDKPVNKRRLLVRGGFNLLCAVIFGLVACFVFVLLKPYLEEWLYPEESSTISIPKDDVPQEEEPKEPEETPTPVPAEPETEPVVVEAELEIEDYQELQNKLYEIGKQANKSIVTVTGVTSGKDWFNTPYENENSAAGIVIGNNGQELLILTEKKVIKDAQAISITFIDEAMVSASLKKYDGNTGIAIISVPLDEIPEETMEHLAVASLGNSYMVQQGTTVLAIGSPLGANYSILCGTITSYQNEVSTIDKNFTIFTTDIVGSANGSGVLINLEGEIVGLVLQSYSSQSDRNTITALSISELKQIIEDLSNNRDVPYVGLRLSTVTDGIAREYSIPKGVYIKSVEMDSPAMAAGLQEADVIVKLNGEEVATVEQYNQKIYALNPEDTVTVSVKRQNGEEYVDLECAVVIGVLK